ncbi:N-acetylglucosamine/diacetylchitobiose ABC transporter substrate-binding protein [Actinoplanes sp. NPDC049681]|uniref:N-acetylglucosamine/diacetylchitobiose ABC transporter substrate-binding protein n=1 Tax=Actinoplanes sp. NPDC049681 TaxID=3363905 RepID=UPI00378DE106
MWAEPPGSRRPARRAVLRQLASVPLLTLAPAWLTGCGHDQVAGDDPFGVRADAPLEVVIFDGGYGDEYAKIHQSMYRERFPRARVTHVPTKDIQALVQPRLEAGNPPDVVLNDGAGQFQLGALVNDGALASLDGLMNARTIDDPAVKVREVLLPGTIESGTFNATVYSFNYAYTLFGLYYDAALFRAKGWRPPTTWDEFRALAPKIKAAGMAPWAHAGKYPYYMGWPLADWIQKAGGTEAAMRIDNLEPGAWRQEAVTAALSMVIEMVAKGWVLRGTENLTHLESQQALIDGKAALLPCGTWLENEMKATMRPGVELTFLPVWSVGAGDVLPHGSVRAGAVGSFVVPAKAANREGALEYLRIMASAAGAAAFARSTLSLASVRGSADSVSGSTALSSASRVLAEAGTNILQWRLNDWYENLDKQWQAAVDDLMRGRIKQPGEFIGRMELAADQIAKDPSVTKFRRER